MASVLPDLHEFDDLLLDLPFEGLADNDSELNFGHDSDSDSPTTVSVSEDGFSETESERSNSPVSSAPESKPEDLMVPSIIPPFVFGMEKPNDVGRPVAPQPIPGKSAGAKSLLGRPAAGGSVPSSMTFLPFANPAFFAAAAGAAAAAAKQQQLKPHHPQPVAGAFSLDKRKRSSETTPAPTAAEEKEARRRRNREASDRSRAKRRALLQSLPEHNAALETRVLELERGLSASQAEASALRDQVSFLQSLVSGGGVGASHAIAGVAGAFGKITAAAATAASPALPTASPTTGVVLLAAVCVLSVNQEYGLGLNDLFASADVGFEESNDWGTTPAISRGGRVLLSVAEENTAQHAFIDHALVWFATLTAVWIFLVPVVRFVMSMVASWTRSALRNSKARLPEWTKPHST